MKTTHKLHSNLILFCSFALVLLCSSAPVRALTLPDTAKLLPPETVLLVEVHDLGRLKKQFEETNFYKLYKDPAMAPFFDDLKTKWREKSRMQKNKSLGLLAGIDELPEGRVALAAVFNERSKDAKDPPVSLIIQWGQNINKIKEVVDKKVKQAVENGGHRKTEDYRGVDITTIIRKSSKTLNFCFIEDCLIVSSDMDMLKFVIQKHGEKAYDVFEEMKNHFFKSKHKKIMAYDYYIGIDPGLDGAIAWIDNREPDTTCYEKTPTMYIKKTKREYDISKMVNILNSFDFSVLTLLESVHSMPKQGVASSFNFGMGFGIWKGILTALEIPFELVPPQRWKKEMMYGMGKEKSASILKAKQLFPHLDLKKSEHGIADAILMAVYGMRFF